MALIVKDTPVGIDYVIQDIQTKLYAALTAAWSTTDSGVMEYRSYGRCYRNKKDTGYIAEFYKGKNEYVDAYWDDKLAALSFWGEDLQNDIDVLVQKNIHVVFFVNLQKIKPSFTSRADEEAHLDVQRILKKGIQSTVLTRVTTGLENVLREYPGSLRDDRLVAVDMHPTHCFRFDLRVNYNPFKC